MYAAWTGLGPDLPPPCHGPTFRIQLAHFQFRGTGNVLCTLLEALDTLTYWFQLLVGLPNLYSDAALSLEKTLEEAEAGLTTSSALHKASSTKFEGVQWRGASTTYALESPPNEDATVLIHCSGLSIFFEAKSNAMA